MGAQARIEPQCRVGQPLTGFWGSLGAFSFCHSRLTNLTSIGRYCSIAAAIDFGGAEHPIEWIGTSSFSYDPGYLFGDHLRRTGKSYRVHALPPAKCREAITIGNDVWIGRGAFVRNGVSIGDGAVIGAHAVVTKDVAPFTVVAGNPIRVIRERFPPALIERIARVRWWDYEFPDFDGMPVEQPEAFLDALEKKIAAGACSVFKPTPVTGLEVGELLSAEPDPEWLRAKMLKN